MHSQRTLLWTCISTALFFPALADRGDECHDRSAELRTNSSLVCSIVAGSVGFNFVQQGCGGAFGAYCPVSCGLCEEDEVVLCGPEEVQENKQLLADFLSELEVFPRVVVPISNESNVYIIKNETSLTQLTSAGYGTLDPKDPCGMPGITCNRCGEAIHIQLGAPSSGNIPGRLSPVLFQFHHLQELSVGSITSEVEEQADFPSSWWTNLTELVVLQIDGLLRGHYPGLHTLVNVSTVRLNNNGFARDDPAKLFGRRLAAFQLWDLDRDWLTPGHALPSSICDTRLQSFILLWPARRFEGELPSCMAELLLTFVLISFSSLSGSIGPIMSSPMLYSFNCVVCGFTGPLPDAMASLHALTQLTITGTELTGWIPDLKNLTLLRSLVISKTAISGAHGFPRKGSSLTVDLTDNQIESIDGWSTMKTVIALDLSRNKIRTWPSAGVYPFYFFYSNNGACADPEVPKFKWPKLQRLTIDENPLHNGSLWHVLKSITYLPLNSFSAVNCGLSGSLESEGAGLVADLSYACDNRYGSAGFQSLTSLNLRGNNISGINGPPWTALMQVDLSSNSLVSLHPSWYSDSNEAEVSESALLTVNLEDNPDLRLYIEPALQLCDHKEASTYPRANPSDFTAVLGKGYECTSLCHSGDKFIRVGYEANGTSLCRCQAGFFGVGMDCERVPLDHWSDSGFKAPVPCPNRSSNLGYEACGHQKCCYCEAGLYMHYQTECFEDCWQTEWAFCRSCPRNTFLATPGATNVEHCSSCGTGMYASEGSTACTLCPSGSIAASLEPGQGCSLCEPGKFAETTLATVCISCPIGSFQPLSGSTACHQCPHLHTTWERRVDQPSEGDDAFRKLFGATNESACGCEVEYRSDGLGNCIRCGSGSQEGLQCPGGVDDTGIVLEEGYYAEVTGFDYSIYRCSAEIPTCRGGHHSEVCAPGRTGLRCDMCSQGMIPGPEGTCIPCREGPAVILATITAAGLGALVLLYRAVDNNGWSGRDHLMLAAAISFSIFISLVQHLGVLSQLQLSWEEPLLTIMTIIRVVILDMRLVPTGCVIRLEPHIKFLIKVLLVVTAVLVLCIVHVIAVVCRHKCRFRQQRAVLLGAIGTFASIVFMAVMNASLGPFRCAQHPNGKWTSSQYGSVVCWETAEHCHLVIMASVSLLIPLGWFAWVVLLVRQYRTRVQQLDTDFLRASFFVHSRFRPEVYWFILVPMVRGIMSTVALVIPDVVLTVLVLQLSTLMACYITVRYQPWRVDSANVVDLTTNVGLSLLIGLSHVLLHDGHNTDSDSHVQGTTSALALCLTLCVLVALPIFFLRLLLETCTRQQKHYEFFLCHHKAGAGAFSRLLKISLGEAAPSRGVFFETTPLESLHVLLYTIQEETEVFILVGSGDLFTKTWCLAELAASVIAKVDLIILELPDFTRPSRSFIEELETHVDMADLIERGLSVAVTQAALEKVCTHPSIAMPEHFNRQAIADLVAHLSARTSDAKVHYQRHPVVGHSVCVLADHNNREAAAAALIVEKVYSSLTAATLKGAAVCFVLPPHAVCIPEEVAVVALLCSSSCLDSPPFIRVLTQVSARQPLPHVVPVMVQDSFRFPTKMWLREYLQNNRTVEAEALVTFLKAAFHETAALFQPQHVSEAVLMNQGLTIVKRLSSKKWHGAVEHIASEGGSCETLQPPTHGPTALTLTSPMSPESPDPDQRATSNMLSDSQIVTPGGVRSSTTPSSKVSSTVSEHSDMEVPSDGHAVIQLDSVEIVEITGTA